MRSRRVIYGTISGLFYEAVIIISSLILPRIVLQVFGSEYNGIIASITQFLTFVTLLRAGIGGAARAAMYKPLSENDFETLSATVGATRLFMRRVSLIFAAGTLVIATLYPFAVPEFNWLFSFSLVIIISIGTFAQYYFSISYQIMLDADQHGYIPHLIQSFTNILNIIATVLLMYAGASIHMVKLVSSIVFLINPILIVAYVKKHYPLNLSGSADMSSIPDRSNAFVHQITGWIHDNSNSIILTVFSGIMTVSVYSVYSMVVLGIRRIISVSITGVSAAFGNMLAKNETEALQTNLRTYERIVFSMSSVAFAVTAYMIIPFVRIYTADITDIDYIRPMFALIMIAGTLFSCYRIPYQTITFAAGHFKQTQIGAVLESVINITISLILVRRLNIVGVAIGSLVATIFRSVQYAIYLSRNVIVRSIFLFFKNVGLSLLSIVVSVFIMTLIPYSVGDNYFSWIGAAAISAAISCIVELSICLIFYKKDTFNLISTLKRAFIKKR